MNSLTHTPANTQPPAPTGSKTLWAATLVLVVVVLAMGAALIRIQSQPLEPRMAVLPQPATAASRPTDDGVASRSTPATGATIATSAVPVSPSFIEQNRPIALMNKGQEAIKNGANQAIEITDKPRPVLPHQPEPAVARPPALSPSDRPAPKDSQVLPR